MRAYLEIRNLRCTIERPIEQMKIIIQAPFLAKPCETAVGRGKNVIQFPDECVPLLVPDMFYPIKYMQSVYITATVQFNDLTGVAILPRDFTLPDVFKTFELPVTFQFQTFGVLEGEISLISASEAYVKEQQIRHYKADRKSVV